MADNITVKNAAGTDVVVGAKDLSSVFLIKHVVVDDNGDIALVSAANAALAENAAKFLQTASVAFALDDAASAGSQAVPLEVESTAQPNLKVTVKNGANAMPAGDANSRPVYVTPVPSADNGGSLHTSLNLAATVAAVKASAGMVDSITVTNSHSAVQYLQVFNTASGSVTLGTTTPVLTVAVPATNTVQLNFDKGLKFGTAISIAATTTPTGATGATASTMHATVGYK